MFYRNVNLKIADGESLVHELPSAIYLVWELNSQRTDWTQVGLSASSLNT